MPKIPATALISPTAKVPVVNTSPIYSKSLSQSACLARCNQSKNCWEADESEPDYPDQLIALAIQLYVDKVLQTTLTNATSTLINAGSA